MESGDQLKKSKRVMICDNCGHPVIQPEVDENGGNCINCEEKFQPFIDSSE